MDLKGSLVIAKYLLKNYVLNPFLKKFKTAVLSVIVFAVIIGLVVIMIMSLSPGEVAETPEVNVSGAVPWGNESLVNQTLIRGAGPAEESEESAASNLRAALRSIGLTKHLVIDLASAVLTAVLVVDLLRGNPAITVMEEAEYEVLLSQPIDMRTYMVGRSIYQATMLSLFSVFYLGMIPLVYELSGSSTKALLFPIALMSMYVYLSAIFALSSAVKIYFKNDRLKVMIPVAACLGVGAAHSLYTSSLLPIITMPFRPAVEPLVYCATLSETPLDLALALVKEAVVILVIYASVVKLADRIYPENIKPVSVVLKEKQKSKGVRLGLYSPDPGKAIFNYVYAADVLTKTHARNISLILALTAAITLLVKHVVIPRLGTPADILSFLSLMFIPLFVAEMISFLSASIMAKDFLAMWVYRVYGDDLTPLAKSLLLKYATYLTEALLVLSLFNALITDKYALLLFPIFSLPPNVLLSSLVLLVVVYLASKRRIVKQAPTGLYVFEDLTLLVVSALLIPSLIISDFIFKLAVDYLVAPVNAALVTCISLIAAWLIYRVFSPLIAEFMVRRDLAS